ncbi:alpha/beta fold hydrolase [Halopiger thermotolerans]
MCANAVSPQADPSVLSTGDTTTDVRTVNSVDLHVVAAGHPDDPLAVLLHGFPEFWYGWREQIRPLVDAGYRVLAPDQRGYNLSEKPTSVRAYRRRHLARDVVELIASEDRDEAHVVGHDWGGIVAWDLALRHPAVVDRLAIVNAPHPTVFRQHLRSNPAQLRRSWYAACFQVPRLPELVCRYDDFRLLERALRATAAPGTFSDADLERYRRAWSREGALSGMLNWYRASARDATTPPRDRVEAPTLLAWGTDDAALGTELAVDSYDRCAREGRRLELFEGTSHWVQHEEPERLTAALLEHLSAA